MTEALALLKILAIFGTVLAASRFDRRWLHLAIAVNMILVSASGAKAITLFGFTTNAGNIFYAGVFVAIQMLVERYGRREGLKAIGTGFVSVLFFMAMMVATSLQTSDLGSAAGVDAAMTLLFKVAPRVAFASLFAFLAAQYVNVVFYDFLHMKMGHRKLWVRSMAAIVVGQFVDSVLFFTIAFSGVLPVDTVLEFMAVGFVYKVFLGGIGTLFLYASRFKPSELA